jgi:Holliday junction resolvasome RuvABC endonuclease subunit
MKILCLDQATKISGYSIFQNKKLISYGIMEANPKEKNPIERMKEMSAKISKLIDEISPDFVVFEDVQFQQNYKTYAQLSQLQGVVMVRLFDLNLGFQIVPPVGWKSICGIKGRKREEQKLNTIAFVKSKYNVDVSEDEADAIGIGYWAINNISN